MLSLLILPQSIDQITLSQNISVFVVLDVEGRLHDVGLIEWKHNTVDAAGQLSLTGAVLRISKLPQTGMILNFLIVFKINHVFGVDFY